MGTGITPVDVGELVGPITRAIRPDGSFDLGEFAMARAESIFPLWLLQHLPNMAAAHISILHHAMGPNNTIVTACAAGTQAVGEAFRLIARGDADVDAGRRLRQPARPAPAGGLQRHEGGQHLGPAAGRGLAALRRRARRVRPGRGGGRARAREPPPRPKAQGDDLRRGHRLRLVVRRLRHHPPRARRQGRGDRHDGRPARGPRRPRRHRLHQCPRDEHPAQRPDGDGRRQAGLRPPRDDRSR